MCHGGALELGPRGWGPKPRKGGASKFRVFGGLLVDRAVKCTGLEFLGLSCEAPAAPKPQWLHMTAPEPKSAFFQGPGASTHHRNLKTECDWVVAHFCTNRKQPKSGLCQRKVVQSKPTRSTTHNNTVMADFGQTDFDQIF